jgi:hypothetical protein
LKARLAIAVDADAMSGCKQSDACVHHARVHAKQPALQWTGGHRCWRRTVSKAKGVALMSEPKSRACNVSNQCPTCTGSG